MSRLPRRELSSHENSRSPQRARILQTKSLKLCHTQTVAINTMRVNSKLSHCSQQSRATAAQAVQAKTRLPASAQQHEIRTASASWLLAAFDKLVCNNMQVVLLALAHRAGYRHQELGNCKYAQLLLPRWRQFDMKARQTYRSADALHDFRRLKIGSGRVYFQQWLQRTRTN